MEERLYHGKWESKARNGACFVCSFGGGTVDERTADSRSFQMSDHSVKKIIYSEDISYEKDGSFILINNSLYGDADSSVGTDGSTANGYRNVAGNFNASLFRN